MCKISCNLYTKRHTEKINEFTFKLLGFKRAFKGIDRKILITKLDWYGITGVVFSSCFSESLINDYGVPQKNVLRPPILIVYINDIISYSHIVNLLMYLLKTH